MFHAYPVQAQFDLGFVNIQIQNIKIGIRFTDKVVVTYEELHFIDGSAEPRTRITNAILTAEAPHFWSHIRSSWAD